jgi:hypothetical protein
MEYLNKAIYTKAKLIADEKYKRPSAYKSAFIVKTYKELGGLIDNTKGKNKLKKWVSEDWKNLTPYIEGKGTRKEYKCGDKAKGQKNPSVCRPLSEVDKYTKTQIKNAVQLKKEGKTIKWKELKKK